jgi:hypothetical protein
LSLLVLVGNVYKTFLFPFQRQTNRPSSDGGSARGHRSARRPTLHGKAGIKDNDDDDAPAGTPIDPIHPSIPIFLFFAFIDLNLNKPLVS